MAELTISITVPYESDDDLMMLTVLLGRADALMGQYAQEAIEKYSGRSWLLLNALPHPRPPEYIEHFQRESNEMQRWLDAKVRASSVILGAKLQVIKAREKAKEPENG